MVAVNYCWLLLVTVINTCYCVAYGFLVLVTLTVVTTGYCRAALYCMITVTM